MILKSKSSRKTRRRKRADEPILRFPRDLLITASFSRIERLRRTLVGNHRFAKTTAESKKVREIVARLAIRRRYESHVYPKRFWTKDLHVFPSQTTRKIYARLEQRYISIRVDHGNFRVPTRVYIENAREWIFHFLGSNGFITLQFGSLEIRISRKPYMRNSSFSIFRNLESREKPSEVQILSWDRVYMDSPKFNPDVFNFDLELEILGSVREILGSLQPLTILTRNFERSKYDRGTLDGIPGLASPSKFDRRLLSVSLLSRVNIVL